MVSSFIDPVVLGVAYLSKYFDNVYGEAPDGADYDHDDLIILVRDGGGSGVYSHQLSDARLTFEVRSGSRGEAAEVASQVDALVRDWPYREGGVYLRGALSRPTYQPEVDERIPAYVWTINYAFRGSELQGFDPVA